MSYACSDSDQNEDESGEDFSASEDEWTPGKAGEDGSDDDEDEIYRESQVELSESSATEKDTKK